MSDILRPASGKGWRYRPANSSASLSPEARALGRKAMDAFLLSPQMQKPVTEATKDVEGAARALTVAIGAVDTGDFLDSFDSGPADPIVISGNPRVAGRVTNDSDHAAAVEYGNSAVGAGRRVLGRAAQPWHTEKRPL